MKFTVISILLSGAFLQISIESFFGDIVASYCRLIFYELACSTRQLFNLVGFSLPKDYFANCRMISEEKEIYLLFKD